MGYRVGVWVFDRRTQHVGKVITSGPSLLRLRSPTGFEWSCPHSEAVLVTAAEVRSANNQLKRS